MSRESRVAVELERRRAALVSNGTSQQKAPVSIKPGSVTAEEVDLLDKYVSYGFVWPILTSGFQCGWLPQLMLTTLYRQLKCSRLWIQVSGTFKYSRTDHKSAFWLHSYMPVPPYSGAQV